MNHPRTHQYLESHPWITFDFDPGKLKPATWILLGEAASKCEHLAHSAMPPEFARELNTISLSRGAYGTTSIEGNTLSQDEVRAIVQHEYHAPPSRSYQAHEIENLLGIINEFTCNHLDNPPPLSVERLKDQHRKLLEGQPLKNDVVPGQFRTHNVMVGSYRGAPPEDCDYLVGKLCEWLNGELEHLDKDYETNHLPLSFILANLAHLHLTWIHPFGDGNGRMSRLLELEIMLRLGVPVPAAHLLSDHYNKTRDMYYAMLEQTSRDPKFPVEKFIHYATEGLVDGLRDQINRVQNMQMGIMWQSYIYEKFQGQHTPAKVRMRNLVLALPVGKWTKLDDIVLLNKEINAAYADRTRKTITRDINELARLELIERQRGRGIRPQIGIMSHFLPARRNN